MGSFTWKCPYVSVTIRAITLVNKLNINLDFFLANSHHFKDRKSFSGLNSVKVNRNVLAFKKNIIINIGQVNPLSAQI
jgi:hypothetical protein